MKDTEIVIPNELSDTMQVLTTVISPTMGDIGILIMGENMQQEQEGELPIVRIYLLYKEDSKFHVEKELEAFAFHDIESALSFAGGLRDMSALELMLMMNKQVSSHDEGNVVYQ